MFIKKVALGSEKEAYVESRLNDGFNIIYSTADNNKGKTIVIQSMMYALGNRPIFPSNFPYDDYYHICEVVNNGKEYTIMRKKTSFSVLEGGRVQLYGSVSEFKRFLRDNLFDLPELLEYGRPRIVYPDLFYQLFFIGQDNRSCSDIVHKGQYNKKNFKEMLCRYAGIKDDYHVTDMTEVLNRIESLKEQKANLNKQLKALKKGGPGAKQLYSVADKNLFEAKCQKMEELNEKITLLRKDRNKAMQRVMKTDGLIKELQSLNNALDLGEIECKDCGSHNISYKTKKNAFEFDVSNKDVQKSILASLEDKKDTLQEECDEISRQIADLQIQLDYLVNEDGTSLESLMAYKNRNDLREINNSIEDIDRELSELQAIQIGNQEIIAEIEQKKRQLIHDLVSSMNMFYSEIDPDGKIVFEDLFTTQLETYSGSEEMEFFLSRLYAFATILNHPYPIIVDSFREGELSTDKEARALSKYKMLENQIIFTATLKTEEGHKYKDDPDLNDICYDPNTTSHILNEKDASELRNYLSTFGISLLTDETTD